MSDHLAADPTEGERAELLAETDVLDALGAVAAFRLEHGDK